MQNTQSDEDPWKVFLIHFCSSASSIAEILFGISSGSHFHNLLSLSLLLWILQRSLTLVPLSPHQLSLSVRTAIHLGWPRRPRQPDPRLPEAGVQKLPSCPPPFCPPSLTVPLFGEQKNRVWEAKYGNIFAQNRHTWATIYYILSVVDVW